MREQRPDQEIPDWLAQEGHAMSPEDADRLLKAMRETGDALTPSDQTRREAWARVQQAMAAKPARSPEPGWMVQLFRPWLPGMATAALLVGTGVLVWRAIPHEPELIIVASKGPAATVSIPDFSSNTPALVRELGVAGLRYQYRRDATQGLLIVQVPEPPPQALLQWASRWNLLPPMPGEWRLIVIPARP